MTVKQHKELTFKENIQKGRHGWLRLTPAYSAQVVNSILDKAPKDSCIFDPFSGCPKSRQYLQVDFQRSNPLCQLQIWKY